MISKTSGFRGTLFSDTPILWENAVKSLVIVNMLGKSYILGTYLVMILKCSSLWAIKKSRTLHGIYTHVCGIGYLSSDGSLTTYYCNWDPHGRPEMDGEPVNLEKFRTPEWVVKTLLIAVIAYLEGIWGRFFLFLPNGWFNIRKTAS